MVLALTFRSSLSCAVSESVREAIPSTSFLILSEYSFGSPSGWGRGIGSALDRTTHAALTHRTGWADLQMHGNTKQALPDSLVVGSTEVYSNIINGLHTVQSSCKGIE